MTVLIPARLQGCGRVRQSTTSRALKYAVYVAGFGIGVVIGSSLFGHRVVPAPSVAIPPITASAPKLTVRHVFTSSAAHPVATPARERIVPQVSVSRSAAGPGSARVFDRAAPPPLAAPSLANGPTARTTPRAAGANDKAGTPASASTLRNQQAATVRVPPSKSAAAEDWTNRLAGYRVQVGVFSVRTYAQELIERLRNRAYRATIVDGAAGQPYRVWIEGALNPLRAERLASQLRRDRFDAVVVKIEARVF